MLSRLLKSFGMKDVMAVVDAHPCDENMAKISNSILFQLGREIQIGEGIMTRLRLGLVQVPVHLMEFHSLPLLS